ncbi:MAG TPA: FAD-binding oxidoreductase [Opitutales bacterium]|nr:FAD-binding oxidoreductase [Opitutales bacterium]
MAESNAVAWENYEAKKAEASRLIIEQIKAGSGVALGKRTSNLFRPVDNKKRSQLDLGRFDQVIAIDRERRIADVEGRITYEALVRETLRHGFLPPVVPQLKSITLGGAISGGGIESSSFRYGFVHESILEMDILLPSGEIVTCNPDNEHRELFFGIPSSYGTFGYILRVRIPLVAAAPFVKLEHRRFESAEACFEAMDAICSEEGERADFVDGVVFSPNELYLTIGRFVEEAPEVSDYRFMRIYYRSIRERKTDYLRTADYIWRWDTDWFWCARAFGMEIAPIRFVFGMLGLLRSTTYWKLRQWALKVGLVAWLQRKQPREDVIQDIEVPVERATEFLEFFQQRIDLRPVWLCPAKAPSRENDYVLYRTDPDLLYVNFGFWGTVPTNEPPGFHNRLIEKKVIELDGKKSLYSSSYFSEDEFWEIYNRPEYDRLKAKYDPAGRLRNLYEKCVREF